MVISFSNDDLKGVQTPHDDTLVITMTLVDCRVKRILVDNSSSANILFLEAFQKMGLDKEKLKKVEHQLQGFLGALVRVEGLIELPVRAGTRDSQVTVIINFLVVDITSAYNVILGRVGLNLLKAIVSSQHLKMKFPIRNGVGERRGDQEASQKYYATTLWGKEKAGEALSIKYLRDDTNHRSGEPVEDLILFDVEEGDNNPLDIPGIAREVIEHQLSVNPPKKLVQQKKRAFTPERQQKIDEEVEKLLKAKFIR
ncbi:uncharacterized protein LOC122069891 [Macadamia integrifolia]|uniref:uncharacterized protein LOC122069891 n=1 Tax=Macadamia integrifolia TaxID=60698 RepID=UPI001C4F9CE1|nr:uncharacterized protein LOC122069891 [Macadamia integrifolia]